MLNVWTYMQATQIDLQSRFQSEDGAEMVEYGLVIAVIALGLLTALGIFKDDIVAFFGRVGEQIGNAPPP
jgi:Flp pilus assembly pilin Flp